MELLLRERNLVARSVRRLSITLVLPPASFCSPGPETAFLDSFLVLRRFWCRGIAQRSPYRNRTLPNTSRLLLESKSARVFFQGRLVGSLICFDFFQSEVPFLRR